MNKEETVDIEALEKHIEETLKDDVEEVVEEVVEEIEEPTEDTVEEPEFNLEEALDSTDPIDLTGKITDEEAREKAIERGWREDGVDKYGHKISAVEFLERAPFFRKIDLMRGDVEELKEQNKKIIEQNKKIAQAKIEADKKHVEELRAQKEKLLASELLDKDDINKLKNIDSQIEKHGAAEDTGDQEIINDYEEKKAIFVKENDWYENNRAMTTLADSLGEKYVKEYYAEHKELPPPEDLFSYVKDEIKKDFPDMGKPQKQTRVATTQNRTVANRQVSKKKTLEDLPEDQRPIAREVMESAGLSEEEYMSTYAI
jgi:hypothetical protein